MVEQKEEIKDAISPEKHANKKVIIVISIVVLIIGSLFVTISFSDYSSLEADNYTFDFDGEELTFLRPDCPNCSNLGEVRYVCLTECAKKNVFFEDFLPLFDGKNFTGEFSCICRPLVHVNENFLVEAVKMKNSKFCNKIETPSLVTKDSCFFSMAMLLEDEKKCDSMKKITIKDTKSVDDNTHRDLCYSMLAIVKKEPQLCSKIIEKKDIESSENTCRELVNKSIADGDEVVAFYTIPK